MKDRFDVQLGVARPVARTEDAPELAGDVKLDPEIVVEYRNRGLPAYLVPPLLIVLAALGIMSYQNVSASLPLRAVTQPTPVRQISERTDERAVAVDEKVETAHVVVEKTPETGSPVLPRPPVPAPAKPTIEVVETSSARPAVPNDPPAQKRIGGPQALFEHETLAGLRPLGTAAAEPPLAAPSSRP